MQIRPVPLYALAGMLAWAASGRAQTRAENTSRAIVAPVEQYLMDRDAEIALARSAAPAAISRDASVLVLGRQGYETAVQGKNGFVCAVERSWMSAFEDPQFGNTKERAPICYNPVAARSVVPILQLRTSAAFAGLSKEEFFGRIKTANANHQLPALEPGAMAYMMGKHGYLNDAAITDDGAHNLAHIMFYTLPADSANWGADLEGSPLYRVHGGEPMNIFLVLTGMWSDGTPASRRFAGGN